MPIHDWTRVDAGLFHDFHQRWLAYLEPVAVGDVLPEMPIFLKPEFYVPAPLEATYQTTWNLFPTPLKRLLEARPA
jgi:hypothetical protein